MGKDVYDVLKNDSSLEVNESVLKLINHSLLCSCVLQWYMLLYFMHILLFYIPYCK